MTNEESSRMPLQAWRINLEEDWEVRFWCAKFGCTPDQLKNAVEKAGPMAAAVGHYLDEAGEGDSSDPSGA